MEMQACVIPMEALSQLILLQLSSGGRATLTVTGWSMEPMLRHLRDKVELIPVTARQNKGALILYQRENGQYVLHRIIALDGQEYICCGDNQAEREQVCHSQVIAVVDGFIRKGKHYCVQDPCYCLYVRLWVGLFFLRRPYVSIRRIFGRLSGRLRKWMRHRNSRRKGEKHG